MRDHDDSSLNGTELNIIIMILELKVEVRCLDVANALSAKKGRPYLIPTVYQSMDKLLKKGIISCRKSKATKKLGGKSRNIFLVTDKGRKILSEIAADILNALL